MYDKRCRIGGTLTLDDLAEDARTFPSASRYMVDSDSVHCLAQAARHQWFFRASCSFAASQGWLVVRDDVLTLTTAGVRGGLTVRRYAPHGLAGTMPVSQRCICLIDMQCSGRCSGGLRILRSS